MHLEVTKQKYESANIAAKCSQMAAFSIYKQFYLTNYNFSLCFKLFDAVLDHATEVRVGEAALHKLILVQAAVTCGNAAVS